MEEENEVLNMSETS